jgi:type II secretory pathway component PulF
MPHDIAFVLGLAIFVLIGIALLIAAGMVSRRSDALRYGIVAESLRGLGWVVLLFGSFVWFAAAATGAFVFCAVTLIVGVGVWFKRSEAQQNALLWVLRVSAERSLPLAPAVNAFAREGFGRFAWKARRLAAMLASGVSLPEAAQRCGGLLAWRTLPLIWVGDSSDALAPALRRAAAMSGQSWHTWESLAGKLTYMCVVPLSGMAILTFLIFKIVPSFVKIFKDFHTELPPMTRAFIAAGQVFNTFGLLVLLGFLVLCGLLLYVILRYWGVIQWDLPGVGRLTRRADTALVFEALSLAAERQRPLPESIAILARHYPKKSIRRRLALVSQDVDRGGDWCESLLQRGLMRQADQTVLQAAQRVGNLAWALVEMADSNRRRLNYRMYALVQLLFPPVVLAMGLIVMFVVVSLFLPLLTLISKLAN